MRIADSSLLNLVVKVISWISRGNSDLNLVSLGFEMDDNVFNKCCNCEADISSKSCPFCCQLSPVSRIPQRSSSKVCPFESSVQSPESLSPCFAVERFDDHFICALNRNDNEPSSVPVRCWPSRYELHLFARTFSRSFFVVVDSGAWRT